MYTNGFVLSLKIGEKFLSENSNRVTMPFGSEYSVYLKNADNKKAVVEVLIDGQSVLGGNKIVVMPNSALDLEGYLNGDTARNKFKFIERTKDIEKYRGINIKDGLVEVIFQYEKLQPVYNKVYTPYIWTTYQAPSFTMSSTTWSGTTTNGENSYIYMSSSNLPKADCFFNEAVIDPNIGITVKGNDINQKFYPTYVGSLEDFTYYMSLKIVGDKPFFTTDKIQCQTCGLISKITDKFCSRCGTRLVK